jgi:hypothetical protein
VSLFPTASAVHTTHPTEMVVLLKLHVTTLNPGVPLSAIVENLWANNSAPYQVDVPDPNPPTDGPTPPLPLYSYTVEPLGVVDDPARDYTTGNPALR